MSGPGERDESKKVHDWFFQSAAVMAIATVALVVIGEYEAAILPAVSTAIALIGGVYALRRWKQGDQ
jgi:uncharacterized membrane protein YiaA